MDDVLRDAMVGTAALQLPPYESGIDQLREFDLKSALRAASKSSFVSA